MPQKGKALKSAGTGVRARQLKTVHAIIQLRKNKAQAADAPENPAATPSALGSGGEHPLKRRKKASATEASTKAPEDEDLQ